MSTTPRPLARSLQRAHEGKSLTVAEASELLRARGSDLDFLLDIASRIRDAGLQSAGRPGVVTYSKKVFIPLTRLCRDRCHYCTFATSPAVLRAEGHGMFMEPDEVLEVARQGAALGCHEALFTLGDRPEERWPAARQWLNERGYDDTLSYVRAMAILVLEETGLLPHLNPGVMSWQELQRLKPVAPSMGMMLEQSATRLWSEPGSVHFGSPDKDPALRMRVLDDAGRLSIPFTTGVLVGIGESDVELAQSLFDIRSSAREFGHIQEVIVQNFRAKPDTAMRHALDLPEDDYVAALAVARIIFGPKMRLQAPPNLSSASALARLLAAGVDDWGGVSPLTPDHVNPERPWPELDDLRALTEQAGFSLAQRLTVHPEYIARGAPWVDSRLSSHIQALAHPVTALANPLAMPQAMAWQEVAGYEVLDVGGRTDLASSIDTIGRLGEQRGDVDLVYGNWDSIAERVLAPTVRATSDVHQALALAMDKPAALAEEKNHDLAVALMCAEGDVLEQLCQLADAVRADTVGDDVTYIVNRNINFTNVCYTGCRFCAFAQRRDDVDAFTLSLEQVAQRAQEAWLAGATEVCMQGGIHPDLPGTAYFDLAAAVKQAVPQMHLHAFSPMEVINGASRSGVSVREWLLAAQEAGLDTIPGTAAEILDDDVRWVLTRGKLPTSAWIDVIATAHSLGIKSSSTMMYGHVDQPHHWVSHIRLLAQLQDQSGGFTEFVPLPFVHQQSPVYLAGIARPGPSWRDNRAVHAMARLMLHGRIDHIQASWVKVGDDRVQELLRGGVDDLGGTLMEETISRMAGSDHGSRRDISDLVALAHRAGRPARQRTTTYDRVAVSPLV